MSFGSTLLSLPASSSLLSSAASCAVAADSPKHSTRQVVGISTLGTASLLGTTLKMGHDLWILPKRPCRGALVQPTACRFSRAGDGGCEFLSCTRPRRGYPFGSSTRRCGLAAAARPAGPRRY